MKLCKDCKYSRKNWFSHRAACTHKKAVSNIDYYRGATSYYSCDLMRADTWRCGKEANLFEPKGKK